VNAEDRRANAEDRAVRSEELPTSTELASAIAEFAADKKAIDVVEIDLRGVLGYTDYFLICSGNTERQTKAIHDGIHLGIKQQHGTLPGRVEGLSEGQWVLMDYLDVVVHIFTPVTRDFYRLEQLWGEAPARTLGSSNPENMDIQSNSVESTSGSR
jgi:ribosome-associated protein